MGFKEAVLWWEEWQLRLLVLSLFIQFFLFFAGILRKNCIPSWFRLLIWLAYLGSDAVAIYALATFFNRNKEQGWVSSHGSSKSVQLLWAPILLMHLGGQNGITAYNIEDNELWRRHVLTTVSQPWDLKRASINSLVDSSRSKQNGEIHSLHQYVGTVRQYFLAGHGGQPADDSKSNELKVEKLYDLLVDIAPSYSDRYSCLKHLVHNGEKAHRLLRSLPVFNYESSRMKAYNDINVKITYTLLVVEIVEVLMSPLMLLRNVCKDNVDQLWCMKPSKSSRDITELIHGYIAKGWMEHHIKDIATYREFNANRGNWTLKMKGCGISLEWSLRRPFDESVLLWHLATDFCFHRKATPPSHEAACRCREMSNYMAYPLFVNPEMLITGARRNLFKAAYREIKRVLREEVSPGDDGSMNTPVGEKELTLKILEQVMVIDGSGTPHDARWLAHYLMELCSEGEDKTWRVIQGVWVEMLCFSAGRCRGYLHAKSLGKGGEYLSYVWLLMSYMGMETLSERMQRMEVQEAAEEEEAWRQSRRPYISTNGRRSDNNV
ncbi:uncharacterized protein C2845_PM17G11710 [Panicum miliaceum]|uniref:DUF4220 domain-containing protein n=1 Tax=Panicum miliaceum TaxID=4540 RepID=A0A3L6Q284_PANMI|nr:uncharacterized protein C2845_PM17G11710 [Panicum miliaceum]